MESEEPTSKVHYICQTYTEKKSSGAQPSTLQVGKLFQYTKASEAEERAERENRSQDCVGADAYMVTEDLNSGEVSMPTFLARFGTVPENESF